MQQILESIWGMLERERDKSQILIAIYGNGETHISVHFLNPL
jgi:hypothetical protein